MKLQPSIRERYISLKKQYLNKYPDSEGLRKALEVFEKMQNDEEFYRSKSRSYARDKIKKENANFSPDENMLKFYRHIEKTRLIESDGLFSRHGVQFLLDLTTETTFFGSQEGRELFADLLLDLVDGHRKQLEKIEISPTYKKRKNNRETRDYLKILQDEIKRYLQKDINMTAKDVFNKLCTHFEQNEKIYTHQYGIDFEFSHWKSRSNDEPCITMTIGRYKGGEQTYTQKSLENQISSIRSSIKKSATFTI